ncbi:MAG: SLC13 family permease [Deltaproteobacteria bacterium]
MSLPGIVIFALTYLVISSKRGAWLTLDRPAAALLGAVACVASGVLLPRVALEAVDGSTLLLLFGMMGMGAFLALDGGFEQLEQRLSAGVHTPARLLGWVLWGAGLASALITNDAVCVLGAPLVVRLIARHRLPPLPFLLALATGANTGSVATLVGNPQNMLCGVLGGLSYREHLVLMLPVALAGLALNHGLLHAWFRPALTAARLTPVEPSPPWAPGSGLTLLAIGGSVVVYLLGADLAWTAAGGFGLLVLLRRIDPRVIWPRIDWALLVFFAALFVVVRGFSESGAPALLFARFPLHSGEVGLLGALRLAGIFLVGSNLVSNVPFILVVRDQMATLPDPRLGWELLAMASTFAGNLTLLGSVANIIVAEAARDVGGIGFWDYLKLGLPVALSTTLLGVVWLVAVMH